MHTLKLNVPDDAYQHIVFLLKGLNNCGVQIIEIKKVTDIKESIKELLLESDIKPFSAIDDPVKWQEDQRKEW